MNHFIQQLRVYLETTINVSCIKRLHYTLKDGLYLHITMSLINHICYTSFASVWCEVNNDICILSHALAQW